MRISIIGTGRIGTSIGLALRASEKKPVVELWGHDKERRTAERARELGAIDKAHWNLLNSVEGADLVVLAIPLDAIKDTLRLIGPVLKQDCTVTDTAGVKVPVLQWAAQALPARVHFVGGNPLLGPPPAGAKTLSGPGAASADLFRGAPYCLVPQDNAHEDAIRLVSDFVTLLGARPMFTDAAEHDGAATAVRTLPSVAAAALLQVTTQSGSWRDMRRFADGTFAGMTDPGPAPSWRDTLLLTQASILPWLDAYISQLEDLRARIAAGDSDRLAARLSAAQDQRLVWLSDWEKGNWPDLMSGAAQQELPNLGDAFSRFMLGGLGRGRGKDNKDKS